MLQNASNVVMQSHINVPLQLLQLARHDGLRWSLVALSVAIKSWSPSSCYVFRSVHQFRNDFHISHRKALRLLDAVKAGHDLFRVDHRPDGTIHITATSYKRHFTYTATFSHHQQRYVSPCMVAAKVTLRTHNNIRVTAIEKEMRHLLLLAPISAKSRADELQTKGCPLKGNASHAARKVLSVPYLSEVTGRCPRTIIRMTRCATKSGELQVIQHPLERRCDDLNHTATIDPRISIVIGTAGFSRRCNDYVILQSPLRHSFVHIIYKHHSRRRPCISLRPGQTLSQTDLHALYD